MIMVLIIIKDSIITNNVVVGYGGGIYAIGAMKITNSTISNNLATGEVEVLALMES